MEGTVLRVFWSEFTSLVFSSALSRRLPMTTCQFTRVLPAFVFALMASALSSGAHAALVDPNVFYAAQWIGVAGKSRLLSEEVRFIAVDVGATPSPNTPVPGVTTSIVATHPGYAAPLDIPFYGPGSGNGGLPDEFIGFVDDSALSDPTKQGPWTVTVTTSDGMDSRSVSVQTTSIDPSSLIPTVVDVAIVGNGLTPTVRWALPSDASVTSFAVNVLRITNEDPFSVQLVYRQADIPSDVRDVSIPLDFGALAISEDERALIDGSKYEIRIDARNFDGPVLKAASFAHFEFRASTADLGAVFLPTVTTGPDGNLVFNFDVEVFEGETIFIDPEVAIGYDYAIGDGDPGFASVLLPDVGDGLYDLVLFDAMGQEVDTGYDLSAGVLFDFRSPEFIGQLALQGLMVDPAAGLSRFGVRGIEASAQLDPNDVQAFVTGLRFVANGRFTGTQTPVSIQFNVPAPAVAAPFILAFLMCSRRFRRSRHA